MHATHRIGIRPHLRAYTSTYLPTGMSYTYDSDSKVILIDNCCSTSITNDLRDFIAPPRPARAKVEGYNGTTTATMVGTVRWRIHDDLGTEHQILLPNTYYSPEGKYKLLCPQHWAQTANDNAPVPHGTWCATYADRIVLYWGQRRYARTLRLIPSTNVGVLTTKPGIRKYAKSCQLIERTYPTVALTTRITPGSPTFVRTITPEPIADGQPSEEPSTAPIRTDKRSSSEPTKEPHVVPTETPSADPDERLNQDAPITVTFDGDVQEEEDVTQPHPELTKDEEELMYWHLRLGHLAFSRVQHMAHLGLLPRRLQKAKIPFCSGCIYGKMTRRPWRTKSMYRQTPRVTTKPGECVSVDQLESSAPGFIAQLKGMPTIKRFKAATVFVDHYSRLGYIHLQQDLTSNETMKAKQAFEAFAHTHGVRVQHYHADNGRFADNAFRTSIQENQQTISFCGVNAHWQNGIAERRIRDLQEAATTMLLYAQRRWPDAMDRALWPYAMRHANNISNNTPMKGQQYSPIELFSSVKIAPQLRHFHHFGAPAYVLKNEIQQGQKARKWEEKARVGIYLGQSTQHARTIMLILSLQSANVSPQFHCQVDDTFASVTGTNAALIPKSEWQVKARFRPSPRKKKEGLPPLLSPEPLAPAALPLPDADAAPIPRPIDPPRQQLPEPEFQLPPDDQVLPPLANAQEQQQQAPNVRRSTRERRVPAWHRDYVPIDQAIATPTIIEPSIDEYFNPASNGDPLLAYKAVRQSDPDTLYLWQAMRQADWPRFRSAMRKEIDDHTSRGHWKIIKRSDVPKRATLLPAVWSMKRKRRIATREVYKWKARLTVDGSKQRHGIHYDETYSPVVTWATTRFFLIQSLLLGWHTQQLDFTLAYPQADVDRPLYMEIPKGVQVAGHPISSETYVLQLIKNLYGQKQAGRVWYLWMTERLLHMGFTQSMIDPCVFYHKGTVMLVYVDDTILLGPTREGIETVMQLLHSQFSIEDEGEISDYLGVKVTKNQDGTITLSQPHLIQSILSDLHLLDNKQATSRTLPALTTKILHSNAGGEPFDNSFHYRSVIGKLNFLEKSTRPEIAYAVHQCARFVERPTKLHGEAVKRIGRYLLAHPNKGIILRPNQSTFDCWVDASHAGEWRKGSEDSAYDAMTAKSRTGYLLQYAGCPIVWASKLQTEIALSSTEAEYIALSTAMREVIPLLRLMAEAKEYGVPIDVHQSHIHCKVFEDNSGALEMAKAPRFRPRTKHINIKYHHFLEHVTSGLLHLHAVTSDQQIADIFTKPLAEDLFYNHRKAIMGW